MSSIKEEAQAYEPKKTLNIADLEVVSIDDLQIKKETFMKKDPKEDEEKEFEVKMVSIDGEDYRVPNSVLASLKEILKEKPELKKIKVKKSGTGLNTSYTVITLD